MARNTSFEKIEANRRNARRSTGPRTLEGKKVVRWNALKHGLLAQEVLIQAGDGKENKAEFNGLLAQLRVDRQPKGIVEEMQVEKIAICYWRLRRVLRCEIGEIRNELDTAEQKENSEQIEKVERAIYSDSYYIRWGLRDSSMGLEYLIDLLEEIKEDVKQIGYLSESGHKRLTEYFGDDEEHLANRCRAFNPVEAAEPDHVGGVPRKCKKSILQELNEEQERLEDLRRRTEAHENLRLESKLSRLHLPSKDVLDKILRYETTIERQLHRAMSQLEQLQRQRKGKAVPPSIRVGVSSES